MEVTATAVRIYGSSSTRPAPDDQPFVAEGFPQAGDRCSVFLGAVPSSLEMQLHRRAAFLTAAIRRAFMRGEQLDDAIPGILLERRGAAVDKNEDTWHVVYVFERTVDVPTNSEAPKSAYQWLDGSAWADDDTQLRREATQAFDALLAYTVGIITPMFFDRVVLQLAMYYVADDGRIALVAHPHAQPATLTVRQTSNFPSAPLRDRMASLGQQDWQAYVWLGGVWSWHSRALTEAPGWRLFMAAWTGLEILARKAGRKELARYSDRRDLPPAIAGAMRYDHARHPPLAAASRRSPSR